jgi:hypothetical protein
MGVIERLAASWKGASFAVVAAIAWLSAWSVSCPQVNIKSASKTGVEITAEIPSLGSIMVSIEDDDREFQEYDDRESLEDDLEPSGLPGMRLVSAPSLTLSQITPLQNLSLSVLTPAKPPLRC